MLKFIGFAALLLSTASVAREPAAVLGDMMRLQGDFKQCLIDQTAMLGAGNNEGADTILRGASAECLPVETRLRAVYAEMDILSPARIENLMQRDRTLGENEGISVLLRSRAARH